MKRIFRILVIGVVVLGIMGCQPQPDPQPRDASLGDYSGSARWAFELAGPYISEQFPSDAVLYYVSGLFVGLDGRLALDRGSWEFKFLSPSLSKEKSITISHDGEISMSAFSNEEDVTRNRPPIPSNWLNSTEIYEAACHSCVSTNFGIAALNLADPSWANGQSIWWLWNLNNQLVRWDGVVIERP